MKVVAYLRVSSAKQTSGDGFPRQFEAVEKFCAANNLTLGRVFREDISGTVDGLARPIFFEMLESLSPGDVIVCERMDRLARSLMTSEILLKECRDRGLKVYAADRGAAVDVASDGADCTIILIRQVLAAVAEFDKSSLVRKLKASRDRIRARGEHCEGPKPFGHFNHERMTIDAARLFYQCEPKKTWQQMANFLNEGDMKTRNNALWTWDGIRKVIGPHLKK